MKFGQSPFGKSPEGFNPVNMAFTINKLISSVVYPIMLFIAQVYKAIIATPSIRVDDAIRIHSAAYDGLERGFRAIRDDFSVYFTPTFKDAKYRRLSIGPSSPFTLDSFTTKGGFINFDFSLNGRLLLTILGDSFPDESQIPVNSIST